MNLADLPPKDLALLAAAARIRRQGERPSAFLLAMEFPGRDMGELVEDMARLNIRPDEPRKRPKYDANVIEPAPSRWRPMMDRIRSAQETYRATKV
jgi:hypothetical protein